MRFMKRLLTAVYLYLGIFFALCFVFWAITGEEPAALITGISAAAGVESIITGCMRIRELQMEKRPEAGQTAGKEKQSPPEKTDPAWGEK